MSGPSPDMTPQGWWELESDGSVSPQSKAEQESQLRAACSSVSARTVSVLGSDPRDPARLYHGCPVLSKVESSVATPLKRVSRGSWKM